MIRLAVLFATLTSALWAQQPGAVLTLADCIRLANGVPSAVSLARQEREIAGHEQTIARAGLLPRAQINSGFTYNSPTGDNRSNFSFVALNGVREYVALGSLIQELDISGRLRADLERARAVDQAAGVSVSLAQRDLRRAVTNAYYKLLLTRRLARVIEDALGESASFEKRARLLFEGGEAARADLIKAAAQTAFQRQSLKSAQSQAGIANQELASFWTSGAAPELNIEDVLENTPSAVEPAPANAPANAPAPFLRRLEFNWMDAQRRVFEAEAKRSRAALFPQASVVFEYGIDSTALRARDRGYMAGINLTVPVFD
ncbi:MAG: TolC family protein [Acidobacteria bacterium]|nr:TolC family protein [Acidobacteriota bacterium]